MLATEICCVKKRLTQDECANSNESRESTKLTRLEHASNVAENPVRASPDIGLKRLDFARRMEIKSRQSGFVVMLYIAPTFVDVLIPPTGGLSMTSESAAPARELRLETEKKTDGVLVRCSDPPRADSIEQILVAVQ